MITLGLRSWIGSGLVSSTDPIEGAIERSQRPPTSRQGSVWMPTTASIPRPSEAPETHASPPQPLPLMRVSHVENDVNGLMSEAFPLSCPVRINGIPMPGARVIAAQNQGGKLVIVITSPGGWAPSYVVEDGAIVEVNPLKGAPETVGYWCSWYKITDGMTVQSIHENQLQRAR